VIVAPAIKTGDGKVWSSPAPSNHGVVCQVIADAIDYVINSKADPAAEARWSGLMRRHEMGFLTDKGEFLGRREAWLHAVAAGQRMKYWPPERIQEGLSPESKAGLSSEDLWMMPGQPELE